MKGSRPLHGIYSLDWFVNLINIGLCLSLELCLQGWPHGNGVVVVSVQSLFS